MKLKSKSTFSSSPSTETPLNLKSPFPVITFSSGFSLLLKALFIISFNCFELLKIFPSSLTIKSKSPSPGKLVPLPVEPVSITSTVPCNNSAVLFSDIFMPYFCIATLNVLIILLLLFSASSLLNSITCEIFSVPIFLAL